MTGSKLKNKITYEMSHIVSPVSYWQNLFREIRLYSKRILFDDVNAEYVDILNYKEIDKLTIVALIANFFGLLFLTFLNSVLKLPEHTPSPLGWRVIPQSEAIYVLIIGAVSTVVAIASHKFFKNHYFWRVLTTINLTVFSYLFIFIGGGSIEMHFHFFIVMTYLTIYTDLRLHWIVFAMVFLHHEILGHYRPEWVYPYGHNEFAALSHAIPVLLTALFASAVCAYNREAVKNLKHAKLEVTSELEEKNHIQNELLQSKNQLDIILQGVGDGITVQNPEGKIIYANPTAAEVLGYHSVQELIQTPTDHILDKFEIITEQNEPFDMEKLPGRLALKGKTPPQTALGFRRRGRKETLWSLLKSSPVFDETGKVIFCVNIFHDITERRRNQQKVYHLAYFDQLTGLLNRTSFFENLNKAVEESEKEKQKLALLYIDLDKFKGINDNLGHLAGDTVLQITAKRLKMAVRDDDLVARLGGDEFVILVKNIQGKPQLEVVAQNVIKALAKPFKINNDLLDIVPSIGISIFPDTANDLATFVSQADIAMYMAKKNDKQKYVFYSEIKFEEQIPFK